jgi:glutamate synthase (NADPH/NADH) large chain
MTSRPSPCGRLYKDAYERDSCGFGLIASLDDRASHWLVRTAMTSLNRLTHRGAIAADGKTGDGCGLLLKRPEGFLRALADEAGITLSARFACGLVFLSQEPKLAEAARTALAAQLQRQGLELAGWRVVPIDPAACGAEALKTLPRIEQVFVNCPLPQLDEAAFNRRLYMVRRLTEKALSADRAFYIPSRSASTIVFQAVMPQSWRSFTPIWPTRGSRARSRCSTSASRPTRCRSGASRTRTATSPTMGKSTRSRVTATGRARAVRS